MACIFQAGREAFIGFTNGCKMTEWKHAARGPPPGSFQSSEISGSREVREEAKVAAIQSEGRQRWVRRAGAIQGLADIGAFMLRETRSQKRVLRGEVIGPAYWFEKMTGGCVVGNGQWRDKEGSWEPVRRQGGLRQAGMGEMERSGKDMFRKMGSE